MQRDRRDNCAHISANGRGGAVSFVTGRSSSGFVAGDLNNRRWAIFQSKRDRGARNLSESIKSVSQYRFVADQQQAPQTSSLVRNCIFIAPSAALGSARLEKQTSNAETKRGLCNDDS
jgi:hypothetical protein